MKINHVEHRTYLLELEDGTEIEGDHTALPFIESMIRTAIEENIKIVRSEINHLIWEDGEEYCFLVEDKVDKTKEFILKDKHDLQYCYPYETN